MGRGATVVALALVSASAGVAAPVNLDFELASTPTSPLPGWSTATGDDDATIAIDETTAAQGKRSLVIERASPNGVTRLEQRLGVDALGPARGARRMRLRGMIDAAPEAAASLWLRLDGAAGPLFLDSRGDAQEARFDDDVGTTAEHGASAWRQVAVELPLPSDTQEVAFGVALRGAGTARFDALAFEVIDAAAAPPPNGSAQRYLDAALAIIREHALYASTVDWPALRATALEFARGATGPGDTHPALRFALRALGDRHSYLQSAAATQQLRAAAVANARTRQAVVEPVGRREGRVAYLLVPGFAGGTALQQVEFANQINKTIQEIDLQDVCGWIVDVRSNSGGNLWPMLAGLGPLLGDGEVAASVYPDGRRIPVSHRDGQARFGDYVQLRVHEPYRLRAASPPIAVLTGRGTASSAEVLVLAFAGLPHARTFGAPTRGLAAGNRTFELADGAALVLTVAGTADRFGRLSNGPLVPDEPVAAASTDRANDPVAAAARRWLEAQPECGR